MKKIILTLLILAVLAGAGTYFYNQKLESNLNNFVPVTSSYSNVDTGTTTTVKTFTMSEVAAHNTKSNCWMVIDGKVLDVSSFVSMHPGGEVIVQGCGVDATGYFTGVKGHMKSVAQGLLKKLQVGELAK